jgi:HEAT repeat protein
VFLWLAKRKLYGARFSADATPVIQSLAATRSDSAAMATLCQAAIDHPEPSIRREIAAALGNAGSTQAVPALLTCLRDSDKGIAEGAARSLKQFAWEPASIDDAVRYAELTGDLSAADTFGTEGKRALGRSFLKTLSHGSTDQRRTAADALARLGDKSFADAIANSLSDPNDAVRGSVAQALIKLHDPRGSAYVLDELRRAIVSKQSVSEFESAMRAAKQAAEMGSNGIGMLIELLSHHDGGIRVLAAIGLKHRPTPDGAVALSTAIGVESDSYPLKTMIEAIGKSPCPAGVGHAVVHIQRGISLYQNRSSEKEGGRDGGEIGQLCIALIENTIRSAASDVSVEHLRAVAALEPNATFVWLHDWTCGIDKHTIAFDCQQIRQLARQELVRRGVSA